MNEEPYWESYNKWMCFSVSAATPYCAEIDYGQDYLPTLGVIQGEKRYELDLDPQPGLSCEAILSQWIDLLKNQNRFCVFAAYLQNIDEGHELWVIDTIKSGRGEWSNISLDQELIFSSEEEASFSE